MPSDLFISWPDFESALAEEMSLVDFVKVSNQAFKVSSESIAEIPAFARQALPDCRLLENLSVKESAHAILDLIPKSGSWRIHFGDAEVMDNFSLTGRRKLVETALKDLLKKKDRFGLKRMVGAEASSDFLLQYFNLSKGLSAVSLADKFHPNGVTIQSGICGRVIVPDDKRPPARAYKKLVEALLISGMKIGKGASVVDLGSSPGSWAWVCLESGAKVTAVDRAELAPSLMRNPSLRFIKGDAFKYEPQTEVDWLVSDIISTPDRIIELLRAWIKEKRMKNFCVTVKFKGEERVDSIIELKDALKGTRNLVRHLENNKNEVTAIGKL